MAENDKTETQGKTATEDKTSAAAKKAVITDAEVDQIAKSTGEILKAQPKRKVRLYLAPEDRQKLEAAEKAGKQVAWPQELVQINGYGYIIQRGKEVEVPESVYEVLEQSGMI